MIVATIVEDGSRVRHYSDRGVMIRQIETGALYEDVLDYLPCRYTYEETEDPIPSADEPVTADEAMQILFGGDG